MCARTLRDLLDEVAPLGELAALTLLWEDTGDSSYPVEAQPTVVFDDERRAMQAGVARNNWQAYWNVQDYLEGPDPDRVPPMPAFGLPDLYDERTAIAIQLSSDGQAIPNRAFWPVVARLMNNMTPPPNATADWAVTAMSRASDTRGQLLESLGPERFAHLESRGYIGEQGSL